MAELEIWSPDPEFEPGFKIPGYTERMTSRGYRVIELDAIADPAKRAPGWLAGEEKKYTSRSKFEREMKRNWNVGDGDIFFPEFFENGGRARYVTPITHLIEGPIIRGWDFGQRAPAVVWFQYDRKRRRALILRSLTPNFLSIHALTPLVLYLSGQVPFTSLDRTGQQWVAQVEADSKQYRTPWFVSPPNRPLQFIDYGGWEATYTSDMVREEDQAKSRAEALAQNGIFLSQISASTKRDVLMRELLGARPDGWPGILIDPSNELLIEALASGLVFKKPTLEDPLPSTYQKDGVHDNVYEAVTYGLVAAIPLNAEPAPNVRPRQWDGDRRLIVENDVPLLFHEGRLGH